MTHGGRLTWERALAWRMGRHHLVHRAPPGDLVRVTARLGGVHAQVMSSAELSLGARLDGLDRRAVARALWERRSLVKLWAMRGTLHLLPATELGLWLAALGTHTRDGNAWPEMEVLSQAVARALDGRWLTREELAAGVERLTGVGVYGEWVRSNWGSYLKAVSFRGGLCFAPSTGGRVRFSAPETWLAGGRGDRGRLDRPDPQAALREVTRRYLGAYAPATAADLGRWWGVGPSRGRRMLAELGEEAVEVDVEGERAWVLAHDVEAMASAAPPPVARLLPAFDPWVVGSSRDNAALLDPRHRARVHRGQGWISPVLLVNGRMAGVWRHARRNDRIEVELAPFEPLPAWTRLQLEIDAERLAGFLGGALELRVATPRPAPRATAPGRESHRAAARLPHGLMRDVTARRR
jgi:hypothetical protein